MKTRKRLTLLPHVQLFVTWPFGFKNAGATYQRVMVTLFYDMMHKEIEVYDMITKHQMEEDHMQTLRKLFEILRKYQLKLNQTKYMFKVKSRKLLGFVVSNREIEVRLVLKSAFLSMFYIIILHLKYQYFLN